MKLKQKIIASLAIAALIIAGIWWAMGRSTPAPSADATRLSVVATYYPLYDFVRQVGKDHVAVTNMTPAGAEPHDYEPSAQALVRAQKAAVFVHNGTQMEPWTDGFLRDYRGVAVPASASVALQTTTDEHSSEPIQDPHFWLDPVYSQHIVRAIRDGLSKADPAHRADYTKNAAAYIATLQALDSAFRTGLAQCQSRTVLTAHQSLGYLAARYQLQAVSIAGINPEEEPNPAVLAQLSQRVRQEHIGAVFFEELAGTRLAATIATETGATARVFNPIEGVTDADQAQGNNYVTIQYQNLRELRAGLACT